MLVQLLAGAMVVAAQQDRYQQFGKNIGETHNSIGAVLNSGNYDSQWISQAIAASSETIKQVRQEIANKDWPSLTTPDEIKLHESNLRIYLAGLEQDEQNMRVLQSQVLADEAAQPKTSAHPYGYVTAPAPAATNALLIKAVVKENQDASSTTESASSATPSPTDKAESKSEKKEEKSESKSSKKEEKSESKESKSASKSASKASKSMEKNHDAVITGNAKNSTNGTASATQSPSGTKHHHKNAGAIAGVSSGAIFLAVMALL